MSASTYLGNALLNETLRGVNFVPPSRVYISLHTDDPGLNGANEVSAVDWPSYARQDPAGGGAVASGFAAPSGKATANALQMLFPRHDGASPVTIGYVGVWDAATSGNFLKKGRLVDASVTPTTKLIAADDEVVIKAGEAVFAID